MLHHCCPACCLCLPLTHLQEVTLEFEARVIECESDTVARMCETQQRCAQKVRAAQHALQRLLPALTAKAASNAVPSCTLRRQWHRFEAPRG